MQRRLAGRSVLWFSLVCLPAGSAAGQELGAIRGHVVGANGAPVADAAVSALSPQLVLSRNTTTDSRGDYILPHLPPGDYVVTFERNGFVPVRWVTRVAPSESAIVDPILSSAPATDDVIAVSIDNGRFSQSPGVIDAWDRLVLDRLPVEGGLFSAAALAAGPGVDRLTQSLVMIDGAPVHFFATSDDRPVVDPGPLGLQQASFLPGAIRIEASRFQTGAVTAITRPGGDQLTGSAAVAISGADRFADDVHRAGSTRGRASDMELGVSFPVDGRRTWLFAMGRQRREPVEWFSRLSDIRFPGRADGQTWELKATHAFNPDHRVQGLLIVGGRESEDAPPFGSLSAESSQVLGTRAASHRVASFGYTGVVGGEWHLTASGSTERWRVNTDSRSVRTAPTFWDLQSRGAVGGSGCADCRLDGRTNTAWRLSIARALPFGSTLHQFTVGVERSTGVIETSASGFDVLASRFVSRGGVLTPVLDSNGSAWLIRHQAAPPLKHGATGVFVSDEWRPSSTLTVHAGMRWDRQELETGGLSSPVITRDGLSPRVSASWRLPGEVGWTLFAGLARYESDLLDLVDQRLEPVGEWFEYRGPAINADAGADRAFDEALQWLQASGSGPRYTGNEVARGAIEDRLWSRLGPTFEWTFGTSRRIGSELQARADVIWRRRGPLEGGGAFASSGVPRLIERAASADLGWLATRYTALNLQLDYHLGVRADLGARYTLSGLSTVRDSDVNVPDGLAPEGDLAGDRRHRLRLWTYVALVESEEQGTAAVTVLQTVESGAPFGAASWIDIGPWVGADGPRFAPYYFTARDQFRGKTAVRTDLSMKYSKVIPGTLRSELVVGFDVFNLFGKQRVVDPDALVVARTALSDSDRFSTFNPFTDRPQPGIHWDTDPRFLAAAERAAMSVPRAYRATVTVRF
jgi:hypothetical protein